MKAQIYHPPSVSKSWRFECPRSTNDKIAVPVFIFGGVFLLWYEAFHILPAYCQDNSLPSWEVYIHYTAAVYFAVNIYGNMYKIVTTDTSHKRYLFMSSSFLPDGWRYCAYCDVNLPPRSHHCKVCDICILKRDHHCWFAGYCVGYFNHRYYLAMVIHMVVAALYCNIFNLNFVVGIKGHLTLYNFLSYIGPHMGWLLGYYDFYVFCITTLTTVGLVLLFLFSWLLYIQLAQLWWGQTQHEHKKHIKVYNMGLRNNVREVLGRRWFLALLLPWIPSQLPGAGIQFRVKNN